jgi:hypothetical protein
MILPGLAPVTAAAVCVLTAVRSPAADPPADAPAERQAAEKPKPAGDQAADRAKRATRPVDRKLAAARKVNQMARQLMEVGGRGPGIDFHHTWSKRQMDAEREVAGNAKEKLAAVQSHLDRMRAWEERLRGLRGAPIGVQGRMNDLDASAMEFYVAEAEQWLAEAQEAEKPPR